MEKRLEEFDPHRGREHLLRAAEEVRARLGDGKPFPPREQAGATVKGIHRRGELKEKKNA